LAEPFAGYHVLILFIEDHAVLREATKLVLESHGYEVLAVGRAAEALDLLHNGARPSVILLDLIMPDMDGFQFRERQMEDSLLASIPVVVWSGLHLAPSDSQRLHGATVLPKPVNPNVMLQTIEALGQRRG
jgi:two-component system, chemotaxis family, chemotaxis protein CheY